METCAGVLEAYMLVFLNQLKHKRFNDNFICAATWCFQPNCNLHTEHFKFTRDELRRIAMSHQTWRNEIVVGGKLDVQNTRYHKAPGWMVGTITEVTGDYLQISFPESPPEFDKIKDRWCTDIAPVGTKTTSDYEWRRSTLVNAENVVVDAFDGSDWLEATIFYTE